MINKKVEAEGGELIIKNSHGDIAIIPKELRKKVQSLILGGKDSEVDSIVSKLPVAEDYAEDGSLYGEPDKKPEKEDGSPTTNYLFVEDKNDPRYKKYQDSLYAYNEFNTARNFIENTPIINRADYDILNSMPETNIPRNIRGIEPINLYLANPNKFFPESNFITEGGKKVDTPRIIIPEYKKPERPVFLKGTKEYENAQKQVALKEVGLYKGAIDGIWGNKSEAAWNEHNSKAVPGQPDIQESLKPMKSMFETKNPMGTITVHGRDIPYHSKEEEEELVNLFTPYGLKKEQSGYAISRYNEKTGGWRDGILYDKKGNQIYPIK